MNEQLDVAMYWENRYRIGRTSGGGSYGRLADFKASVLNGFVERHGVTTVIEFGCGDGNQLSLARYPQYLGYDVSETAVELCREKFSGDPTKRFHLSHDYSGETAELVLSLDVIFHLVNEADFDFYMRQLFDASSRYIIIYSSNDAGLYDKNPHVLHRRFTDWTDQRRDFKLINTVTNPFPLALRANEGKPSSEYSPCDFYMFERIDEQKPVI